MKKWVLLLISLINSCNPAFAEQPFAIDLNDFRLGLDSNHLPEKIKFNQVQDCNNFWFDINYGLIKRTGNADRLGCLNTSSKGLWSFFAPNGDEWLIRLDCRGNLTAAKNKECFI